MTRLTTLKAVLALCLIWPSASASAQYASRKSTSSEPAEEVSTGEKILNASYFGIPLAISGAILKGADRPHMNSTPAIGEKKSTVDDYARLLPGAVLYGMKAAGVPSRSSWSRMIASDAIAGTIMVSSTYLLKNTIDSTRPDGSDAESFPSGHAATSFMMASLLAREYGHISPWIPAGAYTLAGAISARRVIDHHHWLSDVLTGAGIGLLASEFGYLIGDAIFKDKGLLIADEYCDEFKERPSFIGPYFAYNVVLNGSTSAIYSGSNAEAGTTLGIEGAWFMNRWLGFGGRLTASNHQFQAGTTMEKYFWYGTGMAGAYFNLPLCNRFAIGSKALIGANWQPEQQIATATVAGKFGFAAGTGLSFNYRRNERFGSKLFADLNLLPSLENDKSHRGMVLLGGSVYFQL